MKSYLHLNFFPCSVSARFLSTIQAYVCVESQGKFFLEYIEILTIALEYSENLNWQCFWNHMQSLFNRNYFRVLEFVMQKIQERCLLLKFSKVSNPFLLALSIK